MDQAKGKLSTTRKGFEKSDCAACSGEKGRIVKKGGVNE